MKLHFINYLFMLSLLLHIATNFNQSNLNFNPHMHFILHSQTHADTHTRTDSPRI